MSANRMKPLKTTSSLSYCVKMRRNLFNRRNSRSTSFRLLYNSRSYSQGSFRLRYRVVPQFHRQLTGGIAFIGSIHQQLGPSLLRPQTFQQAATLRTIMSFPW